MKELEAKGTVLEKIWNERAADLGYEIVVQADGGSWLQWTWSQSPLVSLLLERVSSTEHRQLVEGALLPITFKTPALL